jgi:hypothetical protein
MTNCWSFIFIRLYGDKIKVDEMGGAYSMHRKENNSTRGFGKEA